MELIKSAFASHQIQPHNTIRDQYEFAVWYDSLGKLTTILIPLAFSIAAIMISFYFIIAAFELITSQGDKAHIVSARSKIYHSIIGFILLIALFIILQYIIPAFLGSDTFKII